jgi:hypothetical protein
MQHKVAPLCVMEHKITTLIFSLYEHIYAQLHMTMYSARLIQEPHLNEVTSE